MLRTVGTGNQSQGITFDSTLLDMAHLKPGDQVDVEVGPNGTITISPAAHTTDKFKETVNAVLRDYSATLHKLA